MDEARKMDNADVEALLLQSALRHLANTDIGELLRKRSYASYRPGERILAAGDVPRSFYLILNGKVELKALHARQGVPLERGELFGENGIVQRPSEVAAIAVEPCDLLAFRIDLLNAVFAENLPLFGRFFRSLALHAAVRCRRATERVALGNNVSLSVLELI